jgi:hypothetical protein
LCTLTLSSRHRYDDLGHDSIMGNSGKSLSPNINTLMDEGIILHDYYTFKVCSPTRASLLTGRYPWGAGFYDMSNDGDHCTDQFKLVAQLLKDEGYSTHALGKWDVGYIAESCTGLLTQGGQGGPPAPVSYKLSIESHAISWKLPTGAPRRWLADRGRYLPRSCTPTRSGFDTFLGYYSACLSDYWYH